MYSGVNWTIDWGLGPKIQESPNSHRAHHDASYIGLPFPHQYFFPWGMGKNEEWKNFPLRKGEKWGIFHYVKNIKKNTFFHKIHIFKNRNFHKITFPKVKSPFYNIHNFKISFFSKIHVFKISFFTKFTTQVWNLYCKIPHFSPFYFYKNPLGNGEWKFQYSPKFPIMGILGDKP